MYYFSVVREVGPGHNREDNMSGIGKGSAFFNQLPTQDPYGVFLTFHLVVSKLNLPELMTKTTKKIVESYLSPTKVLKHMSILMYKVMMVHLEKIIVLRMLHLRKY